MYINNVAGNLIFSIWCNRENILANICCATVNSFFTRGFVVWDSSEEMTSQYLNIIILIFVLTSLYLVLATKFPLCELIFFICSERTIHRKNTWLGIKILCVIIIFIFKFISVFFIYRSTLELTYCDMSFLMRYVMHLKW